MKQTSEAAVQPRRNLLTALGVWAVGLWSSTKLWGQPKAEPNCDPEYELGLFVGRLCIDTKFRNDFFGEADTETAVKNTGVARDVVKDSLRKIHNKKKATLKGVSQPATGADTPNSIQVAAETVGKELWAAQALIPCNPWPC